LVDQDADERSPPFIVEDLQAQIPRSTLGAMTGVGHLNSLATADRFNTLPATSLDP
jgi:hypothetical protein